MNAFSKPPAAAEPLRLSDEPDFSLGDLHVRPSLREVRWNGQKEQLEPRVMQVLVALARAAGAVVSREELIERCWEGRIVGEAAINRCISKLRELSETGGNASFRIETIPRVGYRLASADEARHGGAADSAVVEPVSRGSKGNRTKPLVLLAALVAVAAVASVVAYEVWAPSRPPTPASSSPAAREASIAVLPFANMSGDSRKQYFSDGISDELIGELSRVPNLHVAARTSSFAFEGKYEDIATIAKALNVRTILDGSVREDGNHVRIEAALVNANDGFTIWSESYDRDLTDILALQHDIARAITQALIHGLSSAGDVARVADPKTINPDAYRKYLEGQFYFAQRTERSIAKAIDLFGQVTVLQPDFADGFAALGYTRLASATRYGHRELIVPGKAALDEAFRLDPDNVRALLAHSSISLLRWDWLRAMDDLDRARVLNAPRNELLYAQSGVHKFLGFPDSSIADERAAAQLDPLSMVHWFNIGAVLFQIGQYDRAVAATNNALALQPDNIGVKALLCAAFARSGHLAEARAMVARFSANPAAGRESSAADDCGFEIAVVTGNHSEAHRIADKFAAEFQNMGTETMHETVGDYYLLAGDYDSAISWLERAYDNREISLFIVAFDKTTPRAFLGDPRWKALTERPLFKEWQTAHDKLAAEIVAGK